MVDYSKIGLEIIGKINELYLNDIFRIFSGMETLYIYINVIRDKDNDNNFTYLNLKQVEDSVYGEYRMDEIISIDFLLELIKYFLDKDYTINNLFKENDYQINIGLRHKKKFRVNLIFYTNYLFRDDDGKKIIDNYFEHIFSSYYAYFDMEQFGIQGCSQQEPNTAAAPLGLIKKKQ